MKNLFFFLFCMIGLSLEAAHFQSDMTVKPTDHENEYLVEMKIQKFHDGSAIPELVASPKLLCIQGEAAQMRMGSEDEADLLAIDILIPKNDSQEGTQVSVLMKEAGQVVLSYNNRIKI